MTGFDKICEHFAALKHDYGRQQEVTSPPQRLSDGGHGPLRLPAPSPGPRIFQNHCQALVQPRRCLDAQSLRRVGDTSPPAPPTPGTATQILIRLCGSLSPFSRLSGPSPPAGLSVGSGYSGSTVADGRPTGCRTQRGQWRLHSPCIQGAVPSTPPEQQWDPTRMETSPRGDHLAPSRVWGGVEVHS